MDISALSLHPYDHYAPELRDRMLEKLCVAMAEATGYRLLTPDQLRSLAEIESREEPVLSLYLQLSPDRRTGGTWRRFFSSLADNMLKSVADRHRRRAVESEFDRIEEALTNELPVLGRGAAFFACAKRALWQRIAVPVPLPDGAYLGTRPYLRPLVRTRDEHDRFVLALLSQGISRFFINHIGQVEEVFQVKGQSLRHMLTDRTPRNDVYAAAAEAMKRESQILAHAAELVMTLFDGRYLLMAGPPEMRAMVTPRLPTDVQHRVGAEFSVETHAGPAEIAAAAEPVQRAIEKQEEDATVRRLLDAGPRGSAWGEQATFDALRQGRVMVLAVDDTFARPGARCPNCGALWEEESPACPACGNTGVEIVGDVVEPAIEEALTRKAAIEIVRSSAAREILSQIGPMAALLRW
jgi:peptide subunit release factor 1 (eRF1)